MLRLITERHVLAYYGLSVEDAALINDEILDYVKFVVNTIDDQLVIEEVDGVLYYSYEGDLEFGLEKREALFNMFSEVGGEEFAKNASEKFRNSSHLFEFGMVSFVGRFAAEDAPPMPDFPPEGFWVNFEGKMYALFESARPTFPMRGRRCAGRQGPIWSALLSQP